MKEVQRFYRAKVARDGRAFTFTYRADSLSDAHAHAMHHAWVEGFTMAGDVEFIGRTEPEDCGAIIPMESRT
jgi:hypothetical protein